MTSMLKPTRFIFNSPQAARVFAIAHCGEVEKDAENKAIILCKTKKAIEAAKCLATKLPAGH